MKHNHWHPDPAVNVWYVPWKLDLHSRFNAPTPYWWSVQPNHPEDFEWENEQLGVSPSRFVVFSSFEEALRYVDLPEEGLDFYSVVGMMVRRPNESKVCRVLEGVSRVPFRGHMKLPDAAYSRKTKQQPDGFDVKMPHRWESRNVYGYEVWSGPDNTFRTSAEATILRQIGQVGLMPDLPPPPKPPRRFRQGVVKKARTPATA